MSSTCVSELKNVSEREPSTELHQNVPEFIILNLKSLLETFESSGILISFISPSLLHS